LNIFLLFQSSFFFTAADKKETNKGRSIKDIRDFPREDRESIVSPKISFTLKFIHIYVYLLQVEFRREKRAEEAAHLTALAQDIIRNRQAHAAAQGPQNNAAGQGPPNNAAAQGPPNNAAAQGPQHNAAAQGPPNNAAAQGPQHNAAAQGPQHNAAAQGPQHNAAGQGPPNNAAAQGQNTTKKK
jgi:hypothetical protein